MCEAVVGQWVDVDVARFVHVEYERVAVDGTFVLCAFDGPLYVVARQTSAVIV